jgi:hypothetical protein
VTPEELATELDGLVHEETQVGPHGVDLTVAEVYDVEEPGRVDFGGGELAAASIEPHDRTWRDPGDDYQWWHLNGGTYLVEYNESMEGAEPRWLRTREEVLARGGYHPTLSVTELDRIPLTVSAEGLDIKENARISTLLAEPPGE